MDRPLILVTNDDGYEAPGLAALAEAVAPIGRCIVVAPEREQSGAGHALTLDRPLRVQALGSDRYRVNGTPTDCVHLAVYCLTGGRLPELIVSGINRGFNVGDDVTYSGTVAGALEGTLLHVPSVAFSLDASTPVDYQYAAGVASSVAQRVLHRGLPAGVLLNVNVPRGRPVGIRITRQGSRRYRATAEERHDPAGRPYYWIAAAETVPANEADSDHRAVQEGHVSICPLKADLTHEPSLRGLADWDWIGQ